MSALPFTALAHPNIALIKYWGDANPDLHIPANGSISMNLAELYTRMRINFDSALTRDQLFINDEKISGAPLERVSLFLNKVREMAGITTFAQVNSHNNFPVSAGLASSASAFAALSLAATAAAGLKLNEVDLSRLARMGSGSACRSIPAGFVEWQAGKDDIDSYACTIAPPEYWDLVDCIALVDTGAKPSGSSTGHNLASTSLLQAARLADAPRRLKLCKDAIVHKDFDQLARVVELDSNLMHAVMLTSSPPLLYWKPATVTIMRAVQEWRLIGLPACYTIDAGPNVHVLCLGEYKMKLVELLQQLPGVLKVIAAHPGGPARLEIDNA
jgi:diphosphomevalonate decarboxylase